MMETMAMGTTVEVFTPQTVVLALAALLEVMQEVLVPMMMMRDWH